MIFTAAMLLLRHSDMMGEFLSAGALSSGPSGQAVAPRRGRLEADALGERGPSPTGSARRCSAARSAGAVSCRNCSSAAAIAAASSGPAPGAISSIAGRGGRRLPLVVMPVGEPTTMATIPVLDHDAVLAAVSPARGDRAGARRLRQLRARRVGDAVQGLPAEPAERRLPRDAGARRGTGGAQVGDVVPGQPAARLADRDRRRAGVRRQQRRAGRDARRARGDRASDRRRGGGRDPGARPRGRRARVGLVGCGLHGAWVGPLHGGRRVRPGRLLRPRPGGGRPGRGASSAGRSATSPRRWRATSSARSRPGTSRSSTSRRLRPGQHLNLLGADGPGKAEATLDAIARVARRRAASSATSGTRPATAAS